MKANTPATAAMVALTGAASSLLCLGGSTTHAFQSTTLQYNSRSSHVTTSSSSVNHNHNIYAPLRLSSTQLLMAKKKKKGSSNGGGGKGFGESNSNGGKKEPKYSIDDKSYGINNSPSTSSSSPSSSSALPEQTLEEAQASMTEFFSTYHDWKPLFRNVMNANDEMSSLASTFLADTIHNNDELWGISTLENRNPWRLLPSKPTSETSLSTLSNFLDEWQQSLLDIPLDSLVTGANDLHFLEEGRRTIAVTRFHVLEEYYTDLSNSSGEENSNNNVVDWEAELFRTTWSEMAHLMSQDEQDTGSLVLLPDHIVQLKEEGGGGLEYVQQFVQRNLLRPIQWLGREEDWEIVAMERGSLAIRLLYKLSDIPDLSERDRSGDEDIKLF